MYRRALRRCAVLISTLESAHLAILADREILAGCRLFPVSSLYSSLDRTSQQARIHPVNVYFDS